MKSPLLSLPGAVPAEGVDEGVAAHYGDLFREQRALADGTGFVDLSHRGVVTVSGEDRLGWLHLLLTQHVSELPAGRAQPVNIDGAIAAVCGDIGIPPEIANALFLVSRVPGITAHAQEERQREKPMRQIDPKDHMYDGAGQRRLPEKRR